MSKSSPSTPPPAHLPPNALEVSGSELSGPISATSTGSGWNSRLSLQQAGLVAERYNRGERPDPYEQDEPEALRLTINVIEGC